LYLTAEGAEGRDQKSEVRGQRAWGERGEGRGERDQKSEVRDQRSERIDD